MWENKRNEKEVLTRAHIETDIKNIVKTDIIGGFWGIVFVSVIFLIIAVFMGKLELTILWGFIIYLLFVFFFLLEIANRFRLINKVSQGNFVVTTAVLTKCAASHSDLPSSSVSIGTSVASPSLNKLEFDGYQTYSIPEMQHYKWSDKHTMDAKSIRDYSVVGDEFYIAVIGNKIYSVYNKKLFEYKE